MKTSVFGLVLLLVLCVTLPAEAQPAAIQPRYQNFLKQHVYSDMTENRCNSVMAQRGITVIRNDGKEYCKETNTFIKASSNHVKAVCGKATGRITSGQPFPVVTCSLHSGERPPHCDYRNGHRSTRLITIDCDQGWPVHYDGDTVVVP